jgi:ribosomal protein S18 acetylase RimI-like enzyme
MSYFLLHRAALLRHHGAMATTARCHASLVNPIWAATTSRQREFAFGSGPARRYHADVLPFAGLQDGSAEALTSLASITERGERVWLFEEPSALKPTEWREVRRISGYQMVCERLPQERKHADVAESVMLDTKADAAAMVALKAIAFPGFFGMRTPELGRYRGIQVGGALVAMAGERLALPGYREVSAICTHPAHLGHGYAQQLTREATSAILAEGDLPFLHVAAGNDAAIHIYEQLGYVVCADALFVQLERTGD